jgi:hypothetical protein
MLIGSWLLRGLVYSLSGRAFAKQALAICMGLLCLSLLGLSAGPITAEAILRHARIARGQLRPGTYLQRSVWSGGGMRANDDTLIGPYGFSTTESVGAFTRAWGQYRGQGWVQDENGVVTLEDDAGTSTRQGIELNDLGTWKLIGLQHGDWIIETTSGTSRERRYYDARTFLLSQVQVFGTDGSTRLWAYSNYQRLFGEQIALAEDYNDGRPDNSRSTQITSFTQAARGLSGLPQTRRLLKSALASAVEIAASFTDRGIVVPVKINGQTMDFLLDSSADGIFIDAGVAHRLGLQLYGKQVRKAAQDYDVSMSMINILSVGSLEFDSLAIKIAPIHYQVDSHAIVGLLGSDFWASGIVGLDFKNDKVTLYPPEATVPDPQGIVVMPLGIQDSLPVVHASIEGLDGDFLFDTTALASIVSQHFLDRLNFKSAVTTYQSILTPHYEMARRTGTESVAPYMVSDLVFANGRFPSAMLFLPLQTEVNDARYDGILGRSILSSYMLYVDYLGRAIYLKPN